MARRLFLTVYRKKAKRLRDYLFWYLRLHKIETANNK